MAQVAIQSKPGLSIGQVLRSIGSAVYSGMQKVAEANSRSHKIEFLQSLSDAELKRRGIAREDIVRHVFADRMGI